MSLMNSSINFLAIRGLTSSPHHHLSRIHQCKVALITGSSDHMGIGVAVARRLAQRGCSLILTGSRNPEKVDTLRTELEKEFRVAVHYIPADIRDLSLVKKLYTDVKHIYPEGVDILVNNAGVYSRGSVEKYCIKSWERDIRIMLTAPFYLTKLTLPDMKSKGWGRIINTSSVYGLVGAPNKASYTSSMHGLHGLTKVVALESVGSGITCNAICPACVNTNMFIDGIINKSKEMGVSSEEITKNTLQTRNPSGQFIEQDQVAELAAFLCSPAADQITGTTIPIDAGFCAGENIKDPVRDRVVLNTQHVQVTAPCCNIA
ncbi:D-beta-hydroxybutyrate dehydrogenase-like [Glandiceps talaboti]